MFFLKFALFNQLFAMAVGVTCNILKSFCKFSKSLIANPLFT